MLSPEYIEDLDWTKESPAIGDAEQCADTEGAATQASRERVTAEFIDWYARRYENPDENGIYS